MMKTTITIGRNPHSTIVVGNENDTVSNDHAEIIQQDGEITFVDHSSNGTVINGQKIHNRSVGIYQGDRILLAGVYELSWMVINRFIIPVGRPTVIRNINGGYRDSVRTVPMQEPYDDNSRPTDLMAGGQTKQKSDWGHVPSERVSADERIPQKPRMETSSQVEEELSKWNWGAFFFGWIWGIFNKVFVALVQLVVNIFVILLHVMGLNLIVPIFSLASLGISIWLGVKGSRMAWANNAYRNLEHFRESRHNWNVAAAITAVVLTVLFVISLLLFIDIISQLL